MNTRISSEALLPGTQFVYSGQTYTLTSRRKNGWNGEYKDPDDVELRIFHIEDRRLDMYLADGTYTLLEDPYRTGEAW